MRLPEFVLARIWRDARPSEQKRQSLQALRMDWGQVSQPGCFGRLCKLSMKTGLLDAQATYTEDLQLRCKVQLTRPILAF